MKQLSQIPTTAQQALAASDRLFEVLDAPTELMLDQGTRALESFHRAVQFERVSFAYEDEPVHLILGGSRKGEDFTPLAAAIGENVKSVHLIGETAETLEELLAGRIGVQRAADMADAVSQAARLAERGDVVILSPAAASFDMFTDYAARGDAFRAAVGALGEAGA